MCIHHRQYQIFSRVSSIRSFWNYLDFLNFGFWLAGSADPPASAGLLASFSLRLPSRVSSTLFFLFKIDSMLLDSPSIGHCFLVAGWPKLSKLITCRAGRQEGSELRLWTRAFLVCGGSGLPSAMRARCWMKRLRRWLAAFSRILRSFSEGRPRPHSSISGLSKLIEKVGWFCDSEVAPFMPGLSSIPSDSIVAIRLRLNLYLAGTVVFLLLFWSRWNLFRSRSSSQLASLALQRWCCFCARQSATKRWRNSSVSLSLSSSSTLEALRSSRRSLGEGSLQRCIRLNYYPDITADSRRLAARTAINIIMIDVDCLPLAELPPGRPFFKKGDFYSHFYFLEEGKASVTISQVAIEVSAPIFLGDYELTVELEYRISSIKSVSRCKVRTVPLELYPQVSEHFAAIIGAFEKFPLRTRVLHYWLKKLFVVRQHQRNDQVLCEQALGVVLSGEFRLSSNIPIVRMKQPNLELLRRFEICSIGENELFEESVVCETHRGTTGVMECRYAGQLADSFEEFRAILSMASFKRGVHVSMSREIAQNCRKKRNLFQNMVPLGLRSAVKPDPSDRSQAEPNRSELSKIASSEEVFTVKDNISQFLHKQWRRGLSLKLPRKQRGCLKQKLKLESVRKKRVEEFSNPEMISLSIPQEFKEVKFNFKMLLKTKENAQMRSRRLKTEPNEPHGKLLFRD